MLHDMRERFALVRFRVEMQEGRTHRVFQMAIGDLHRSQRLRFVFDLLPNLQGFEQMPRSGRDGGNALVTRGLLRERRIADGDREIRLERARERHGEREPGNAGARDQNIEPFVRSVHRIVSPHFNMKGGRLDCPAAARAILLEPRGSSCRTPSRACSNCSTSSRWK